MRGGGANTHRACLFGEDGEDNSLLVTMGADFGCPRERPNSRRSTLRCEDLALIMVMMMVMMTMAMMMMRERSALQQCVMRGEMTLPR